MFFHVKMTHTTTNIAEIYMREIVILHGIARTIVSNKDTKFTLNFWKGFVTKLKFSTTCHP